ncbi:hypothetical protein J3D99_031790 [Burkholderia pseudomallei]|nr:hypothetical protein J3D99_031790 [Burkholderia pseudomallei]
MALQLKIRALGRHAAVVAEQSSRGPAILFKNHGRRVHQLMHSLKTGGPSRIEIGNPSRQRFAAFLAREKGHRQMPGFGVFERR